MKLINLKAVSQCTSKQVVYYMKNYLKYNYDQVKVTMTHLNKIEQDSSTKN